MDLGSTCVVQGGAVVAVGTCVVQGGAVLAVGTCVVLVVQGGAVVAGADVATGREDAPVFSLTSWMVPGLTRFPTSERCLGLLH